MTDNQELMRELAKLGYESHIKDEVVVIVISPADFIRGHKLLKADLERLGWNRTYSYTPSRPLTPEERAEWERYTDPFPELRDAANRQRGASSKQPPLTKKRSGSQAYRSRMAEETPKDKKKVGSGTLPESSDEIPGQMDIFQFLGGAV
jgi:hypothetical protein